MPTFEVAAVTIVVVAVSVIAVKFTAALSFITGVVVRA